MGVDVNRFIALKSSEQVNYLKKSAFSRLDRPEKITFLKSALNRELSAETTACALRILRELNYPDRYYFRKFLYHRDKSVARAAKKAIDEWCVGKERGCANIVKVLKEGKTDDRILLADYFLKEKGKLNEAVLISFLSLEDGKLREQIVKQITPEYDVDEAVLSEAITKGTAWYVRAALVEILGKLRSLHLFDSIDFLLNDKNVEVKLKLIRALLNFESEKRKVYLQKLALDSMTWVRKEAKRALKM
jgi:HEAT repeat protein